MSLKDKVILITGMAGGIGSAVAKECLQQGATVVGVDIQEQRLNSVTQELSKFGTVNSYIMDATDRNDITIVVSKIIQKYGKIDCLFNNAGINRKHLINEYSEDDINAILDLDIKGVFYVASEVSKHMIKSGKGRIVNNSSMAGVGPEYGNSVYGMAKAAVVKLTEVMALEWAQYGISTVGIAPGKIRTPLLIDGIERIARIENKTYEEKFQETVEAIPTKRLIEPEEVAFLVAFLFNDRSYAIRGNTILITDAMVTH